MITEWFPAEVRPVHVGWYEKEGYIDDDNKQWFDGTNWYYCSYGVISEDICRWPRRWRGLVK